MIENMKTCDHVLLFASCLQFVPRFGTAKVLGLIETVPVTFEL